MSKKKYVLDTNVLIHDAMAIDKLGDNIIVIPFCVLEELDNHKENPRTGHSARKVISLIEKYRQKATGLGVFLSNGVKTDKGGLLLIDSLELQITDDFRSLDLKKNDNKIIAVALKHKAMEKQKGEDALPVILISKDINVRIKADALEITAETWHDSQLVKDEKQIYSGTVVFFAKKKLPEFPKGQYSFRKPFLLAVQDFLTVEQIETLFPNQCIVLKDPSTAKIFLGIYRKQEEAILWIGRPYEKKRDYRKNINPINEEQNFAFALCCHEDINLVTLIGQAGTGKTLMALLAGERLVQSGNYPNGILVWRSTDTIHNRQLGYYKGSIDEKFGPYSRPVYDAYSKIIGNGNQTVLKINYEEKLVGSEHFRIEPFIHQRGSTVDDTYLIIDEVQNWTPDETITALTRIGEGTKAVLTGDVEQIDNKFLDAISNGLTYVTELMKEDEGSAHITLEVSERSAFVKRLLRRI